MSAANVEIFSKTAQRPGLDKPGTGRAIHLPIEKGTSVPSSPRLVYTGIND
ncbi:MAG: hypothetical protein LBS20_17560 [Prevotella sp.]|nr:hypothetical protein [Prevotella sp.]